MPIAPTATPAAAAALSLPHPLRRLTGLFAALLLTAATAHAQAPPANDDCAGALSLPVAPAGSAAPVFVASNAQATATAGVADPTCAGYYQGGDVWYTVVVPASGGLRLESSARAGSAVDDTQLTLYSGSCGTLTEIGCNEDIDQNNYFSRIAVGGRTPNEVLYLRASTYGNSNAGAFGLRAQEIPPCAAPTGLAVGGISPTRATVRFVPNDLATGYVITYTPAGGPAQTLPTSNAAEELSGLLPGTAYTVQVASTCGGTQPAGAAVTFTTRPAPTNDDCAGALALPVATACTAPTTAFNEGATASPGVADPACASYQGGDLWYRVVVPANGVVMLETSEITDSNAGDTGLAVYSGTCGGLALLACDDNGSDGTLSYVRLTGRPAGEVLYVRAWTTYNTTGSFALCATTDDALPTTTWTGAAGSADWFAAGNWSAGVPTAATNAYVPGGAARYPSLVTAGLTAQVHTLSIDKFAGFTFRAGTLAVGGNLRCREPFAEFLDKTTLNTTGAYTGGEVQMVGTGAQQLAGIGELFDLRVGAGSAVLLTKQLRLDHFLTLAGGVLNTGLTWVELYNDNPFAGEFESNARLIGETETSYVLGRIQTRRLVDATTGPESFSGLGFTLSTTSTGNVPGPVRLNRYTGTAPAGLNGRPGISRYFVAEPNNDSNLDLALDLHYFARERNGLADADLRAFSSPLAGGMGTAALPTGPWTLEAGGTRLAPAAPDSASTFRLRGLTHLSAWSLGSAAAAPLPVTLTAFTAEAAGPDALLRWATASELNNAYFEVQASADGRSFVSIGRVAGAGTSTQARTYSLREPSGLQTGTARYYRLRQVDANGTGTFSPVRTLAGAGAAGALAAPRATAFPNPYTQALTVRVLAPAAGPVQLVLRDALGRELLRHTAPLPAAGPADIVLPGAARLLPGLYLLGVALPGQPATQLRITRQ